MDPLTAAIEMLRPHAVLYKVASGSGCWATRYSESDKPRFCFILDGSCFASVDGVAPIQLEAGDFLLMPATTGFTISSDPGVEPVPLPAVQSENDVWEIRHGEQESEPEVRMIRGYFQFDPCNALLLVDLLPVTVHVRYDDLGADRLRRIGQIINEETCREAPGRDPILERLVEILLIEVFRGVLSFCVQ